MKSDRLNKTKFNWCSSIWTEKNPTVQYLFSSIGDFQTASPYLCFLFLDFSHYWSSLSMSIRSINEYQRLFSLSTNYVTTKTESRSIIHVELLLQHWGSFFVLVYTSKSMKIRGKQNQHNNKWETFNSMIIVIENIKMSMTTEEETREIIQLLIYFSFSLSLWGWGCDGISNESVVESDDTCLWYRRKSICWILRE